MKGGEPYHGGYVAGVSETRTPENQLQLITDVTDRYKSEIAQNATEDGELLERSLESQSEREIEVDAVTADGGYTWQVAEEARERHEIEIRATNMRGGESRPGTFGREQYECRFDSDGHPSAVRCPRGE